MPRYTWEDDIKHFFTQMNVGCMRSRRSPLDLADYDSVKTKAVDILEQLELRVRDPTQGMPRGGRPWPQDKIDKFKEWMKDGFPRSRTADPGITDS